jgi:hypothetical protein
MLGLLFSVTIGLFVCLQTLNSPLVIRNFKIRFLRGVRNFIIGVTIVVVVALCITHKQLALAVVISRPENTQKKDL